MHVLDTESWSHEAAGGRLVTAVLTPVCGSLQRNSDEKDFVQVAADIAVAIKQLGSIKDQEGVSAVLHRDISANNIGIYEGRGVLFDFSAGKVGELKLHYLDPEVGILNLNIKDVIFCCCILGVGARQAATQRWGISSSGHRHAIVCGVLVVGGQRERAHGEHSSRVVVLQLAAFRYGQPAR